MDGDRFDGLARQLARLSRRQSLTLAVRGLVGPSSAIGTMAIREDLAAKRKE